ncbi:alpha/beta fold hydrolase [Streptomyces sp. NBC_01613]|uniref:alpha/beta fold hydrolase n=1 Tax=Streptomyces sp. NBC_01613 TaxID=2975896 RepID=UPI003868E1EE
MSERMIDTDGVALCTEPFGDRSDPPILLIMGTGASMLWWEEDFCRMLAEGGRFVIRYDHRDTGRSLTYELGHPGYTGADLVGDAVGVLDAYEIPAAHVVGVSAGGTIAQLVALDHADRVRSLVLISTSPATSGDRELPPPTEEFVRFVSSAHADWSQTASVIDYLVDYSRVLAGGRRLFDETAVRDLVRRDVERAHDFAAVQNHDSLPDGEHSREPLSSIAVSTLVIHGTRIPCSPSGTARHLQKRSPPQGCCPWKTQATGSTEQTGRRSLARSSRIPPQRHRVDAVAEKALEGCPPDRRRLSDRTVITNPAARPARSGVTAAARTNEAADKVDSGGAKIDETLPRPTTNSAGVARARGDLSDDRRLRRGCDGRADSGDDGSTGDDGSDRHPSEGLEFHGQSPESSEIGSLIRIGTDFAALPATRSAEPARPELSLGHCSSRAALTPAYASRPDPGTRAEGNVSEAPPSAPVGSNSPLPTRDESR